MWWIKKKFKEVNNFPKFKLLLNTKLGLTVEPSFLLQPHQFAIRSYFFLSPFNWQWEVGFMIKIIFACHTLAKFLRFQVYFMQRTTNSLLFMLIKDKRDLYGNKSLTTKIYFIFIFGKKKNIHLAHRAKLSFGRSLQMGSLDSFSLFPLLSPPLLSLINIALRIHTISHKYYLVQAGWPWARDLASLYFSFYLYTWPKCSQVFSPLGGRQGRRNSCGPFQSLPK